MHPNLKKVMLQSLQNQIDALLKNTEVTEYFDERIERCFTDVQEALFDGGLGSFNLLKYGSIVNGLANDGLSDLDLTLISTDNIENQEELLFKVKYAI